MLMKFKDLKIEFDIDVVVFLYFFRKKIRKNFFVKSLVKIFVNPRKKFSKNFSKNSRKKIRKSS